MISVYLESNTNYLLNGDCVLHPISAELSVEINGIATIEMEFAIDDYSNWERATENRVIGCPTPWSDKQLFRIYNTEKDMGTCKVYARHIISDLMKIMAKDFKNNDVMIVETGVVNGQVALNKLLANTKFKGTSNITKTNNVRWERKTITQALLSDDENSFVKRWGGELFYNNFNISMNTDIGTNNGVRIAYGKNLTGIEATIDMDDVVTRLVPTGANGLRLTGNTPWVDSPLISKYPTIMEQPIEFSDVKLKENADDEGFNTIEEARAELIRRCKLKFAEDNIDKPTVNIKIDMEDIGDTEEYKFMGYSGLESINLGDTIICNNSKINVDAISRCISYKWNILTEKFMNIEIGDVTKNFFDTQIDLNNKVKTIMNYSFIVDGKAYAEWLVGTLKSATGNININLDNGNFQIGGNGDVVLHTNTSSSWKHSNGEISKIDSTGFYRNNRPYYNLLISGYCTTSGRYADTQTIQLPSEWKGKKFEVFINPVENLNGLDTENIQKIKLDVTNIDTANAKFDITGYWTAVGNGTLTFRELKSKYIVIGG